mgnify:CR=1 FL=1
MLDKKSVEYRTLHFLADEDYLCTSSVCMAYYLAFGLKLKRANNYPYGIGDFEYCEELLIAVPELRERLYKMGDLSAPWKRIVDNWDSINKIHTYDYLEKIRNGETGLFCVV